MLKYADVFTLKFYVNNTSAKQRQRGIKWRKFPAPISGNKPPNPLTKTSRYRSDGIDTVEIRGEFCISWDITFGGGGFDIMCKREGNERAAVPPETLPID